jgi:hypothetical protein
MLSGAYEGLGVKQLAEFAAGRSRLLETRFEWAKSQALEFWQY